MVGEGYPRSPWRGLPVRGTRVFITALGGLWVTICLFFVRRLFEKAIRCLRCAGDCAVISFLAVLHGLSAVGRIHQYFWLRSTGFHGQSFFVILLLSQGRFNFGARPSLWRGQFFSELFLFNVQRDLLQACIN